MGGSIVKLLEALRASTCANSWEQKAKVVIKPGFAGLRARLRPNGEIQVIDGAGSVARYNSKTAAQLDIFDWEPVNELG